MKKSSITKSLLRKLVLASLAAGPVALVPTLRAISVLPDTSSANLTAPSSVTTSTLNSTLNITSTSANTVLQWTNFGLGAGGTINYNLPSTTAGILNMVSTGSTTIAGAISSNGRVYVLNPNGITISAGAQISAASFVATTLNDTDAAQSFLATGDLSYSGTATNGVTEAGKITGNVYLAGTTVTVNGDATNVITGDLKVRATTGAVTLQGASVSGNLEVKQATSIELAAAASTTAVTGNVTLTSSGAVTTNGTFNNTNSGKSTTTVDAGSANNVTINGDLDALSITSGNAVSVTNATGITVSGTTAGSLSVTATTGDITLGTAKVGGGLTLMSTAGNINNVSGTSAAVTGTATLDANTAGKSITFSGSGATVIDAASTLAPTVSIWSSGALTLNGAVPNSVTSLTLNATGALTTLAIDDSATGTTKLTGSTVNTGTINSKDLTVTTTAGTATLGAVTAANSATLSITGAALALPAITAPTVTISDTGAITQTGALTASTSASITGGDAITLGSANAIASLKLVDSSTKAVAVTNGSALVLANGTNVAGATTIDTSAANANITFGAGASDTLTFAGLTLTAGSGSVLEGNKTLSLTTGDVSITAGVLDVESTNNMFGKVTGTIANNATLVQNTAINAGAITVGGNLSLTSNTGISTSGVLTVTGTSAFDLTAAGDVNLNTANAFTGAVSVGAGGKVGNVTIKSAGALQVDKVIATTSVTLNSTGAISQTATGITAPTLSITGVATNLTTSAANQLGTVTLATNGIVSLTNSTGNLTVGGTTMGGALTVTNAGAGNLTYNAAVTDNSTVSLTAGVASSKAGDITVNGSTTGNGLLTATAKDGMVHLGSYYSAAGGIMIDTTGTAGEGVDDVAGSRANIYGGLAITTAGGAINLINNAPNGITTATTTASRFGGYTFDTTNAGAVAAGANINVFEGGTIRIASVNAGTGGNISLTATCADTEFASNPSDIVSTAAGTTLVGNNITLNARNSVILNAVGQTVTAKGYLYALANTDASLAPSVVTLGNAATWGAPGTPSTSTVNVTGVIDAIASGDVLIASGDKQAVKLGGGNALTGDFYAGGALSVYSGGAVSQDTNRLRAKGTVTIDATTNSITNGANNIDMSTGTDNEFGGMNLGGKAIKITENGSTRLLSVSATDLTVTSAGDILGSSVATQTINATGTTTLAPSGNVILTNSGNSIATLKITAPGATQNVTLVDSSAVTLSDGSSIGGNFSLTDSAVATPAINEASASAITVGGTLTLDAKHGSISVLGTNNQFGMLAFQAGGAASITQGTNMVLMAGNGAGGAGNADTVLQSVNGGISTDSTAGSTSAFTGSVRLYSHGNVAVDAPWNVAGTLYITTPTAATLDLSGLSLLGNLNTNKPMWNGTAVAAGTDGLNP